MPVEIIVPVLGESVVEATVGRWLKGEGEPVAAGEKVVELETEKVNTEIAAEEAGVLARILRREGETVHPGDLLGVMEVGAVPEGGAAERKPAQEQGGVPADRPAPARESESAEQGMVRVSPVAQRLAEELDVRLDQVRGTGPGGRVMKEDIEAFAHGKEPPAGAEAGAATVPTSDARRSADAVAPAIPPLAPPEGGRPEVRQRLSRRRLTIARRLVEAQQTAAMLTTFNEVDMSALVDLRRRQREWFRRTTGADLGYMPFFVKAVVGALKAFPQVNAELQGEELVLKQYYDVGIAVADPEGLVVPVLRDADRLSFAQIEQAIARFVQRARDRMLSLEELRGGTFTITNGGVFGSLLSTPILNPPQVGILGMHRISDRPVAVQGEVVVRPVMYTALTYDHRVVDGREAVLFLMRVKESIENPERLLLEG